MAYEIYARVEANIFPFGSSALWLDYDLWSGLVMRNGEWREGLQGKGLISSVRSYVCYCVCVYMYMCICVSYLVNRSVWFEVGSIGKGKEKRKE